MSIEELSDSDLKEIIAELQEDIEAIDRDDKGNGYDRVSNETIEYNKTRRDRIKKQISLLFNETNKRRKIFEESGTVFADANYKQLRAANMWSLWLENRKLRKMFFKLRGEVCGLSNKITKVSDSIRQQSREQAANSAVNHLKKLLSENSGSGFKYDVELAEDDDPMSGTAKVNITVTSAND